MTQTLLLTQGQLAQVLLEGARTIAGTSNGLSALSLDWEDDLEEATGKLGAALADLEAQAPGEAVLILTDVPGATPFNVASRFAVPGRIAVLSGVNLPMAVRVCCPGCSDFSLEELASWLEEKGRQSIRREQKPVSSDSGPKPAVSAAGGDRT